MNRKLKLKSTLPTIDKIISSEITDANQNINEQLKKIIKCQSEKITPENEGKIKEILNMSESIITDCHTLPEFKQSKNKNFGRLVYEWQRLSARYSEYKTETSMDKFIHKLYDFDQKVNSVQTETGNLVYNILGFIASFSVVSAAVTAIDKMNSIVDVALFMCFTVFLLLITLIGLNNFYKNNNGSKRKLQDNYFLLKIVTLVLVVLFICKGIKYIDTNKELIFQNIGMGIEKVRQEVNKDQEQK